MDNAIALQGIKDQVTEMTTIVRNIEWAIQLNVAKPSDPQLLNALAGIRDNLELIADKLGR